MQQIRVHLAFGEPKRFDPEIHTWDTNEDRAVIVLDSTGAVVFMAPVEQVLYVEVVTLDPNDDEDQ